MYTMNINQELISISSASTQ